MPPTEATMIQTHQGMDSAKTDKTSTSTEESSDLFTNPESFRKIQYEWWKPFEFSFFLPDSGFLGFFFRPGRGSPISSVVTFFTAVQGRFHRIVAMVSGIACDPSRSRTLAGVVNLWPGGSQS